jgi:hypothetical protein
VSEVAIPALDEVELPVEGSWVAFQVEADLYVLRADPDETWTLLSVAGDELGALRRSGRKYVVLADEAPVPPNPDWRTVVRALRSRAAMP